VLRLNEAPTAGFEEHVGSKTTFRLVTVDQAKYVEKDEIVIMQMQSKARRQPRASHPSIMP
jgi:hypothetical protein